MLQAERSSFSLCAEPWKHMAAINPAMKWSMISQALQCDNAVWFLSLRLRVWSEYTTKKCINIPLDELCGVRYLNPPRLLTMLSSIHSPKWGKKAVQDPIIENFARHAGSPADWTEPNWTKRRGKLSRMPIIHLLVGKKYRWMVKQINFL